MLPKRTRTLAESYSATVRVRLACCVSEWGARGPFDIDTSVVRADRDMPRGAVGDEEVANADRQRIGEVPAE